MNILILGAGQVGLGVAKYLTKHNINVSIVEKSPEIAMSVRNITNINVIVGDALNADVLKAANAENASHLISTMSLDEQNIVACKLAGSLFDVKSRIARIRSKAFSHNNVFELFLKDNFGIDALIYPEQTVSKIISSIVEYTGPLDIAHFDNVSIIRIQCKENTEILNTPLKHLQNIMPFHIHVISVTREGVTFFPNSKDMLLPRDEIYVAFLRSEITTILQIFGYYQKEDSKILIIGGGAVGIFCIDKILTARSCYDITVIEKSIQKAEEISQRYPQITTICGDAINHELLKDAALQIDTAIVCTDDDKVNILSSLFLQQLNINRIITLSKDRNYDSLLLINPGNVIVNPNAITIETIIQKAKKSRIMSAELLKNEFSYFIIANVTESCSHIGQTIESIFLKNQIMPMFIERDGKTSLAKKDIIIELNDRIIITSSIDAIPKIEKIFSNYFFTKDEPSNVQQ